jgi:micrococcal nuclease
MNGPATSKQFAALTVALACVVASILPAYADRALRGSIVVIDGDTVLAQGITVRLLGFDAPAINANKCAFEQELGLKAKARLEELVDHGETVSLQSSGRKDRFGRTLGTLVINGVDVADTMILEELAVPFDGGKRRSWCP